MTPFFFSFYSYTHSPSLLCLSISYYNTISLSHYLIIITTSSLLQRIEFEYMKQLRASSEEIPLPFEDVMFHSQCPHESYEHFEREGREGDKPPLPIYTTTPPSPPIHAGDEGSLLPLPSGQKVDPGAVKVCYVMLVHENSDFAIQIIQALGQCSSLYHSLIHQ